MTEANGNSRGPPLFTPPVKTPHDLSAAGVDIDCGVGQKAAVGREAPSFYRIAEAGDGGWTGIPQRILGAPGENMFLSMSLAFSVRWCTNTVPHGDVC